MKKDFKALILWAIIGVGGSLCASCGHDNRVNALVSENMELSNEISVLNEKVDSLTRLERMSVWFTCTMYDEGKCISALRTIKQRERYYCAYLDDIVPVDEETYIYLSHAKQHGVSQCWLVECECGLWHVEHKTDNK